MVAHAAPRPDFASRTGITGESRTPAADTYKDFDTFCAKAIAGIGKLPDTVADRSIPIRLKRARRGEVETFRKRDAEHEASEIKARLAAWCAANIEKVCAARPEIPEQLSDRQADCCEPLLAVADLTGGDRAVLVIACPCQVSPVQLRG